MKLYNAFLVWFFITLPLSLFYGMGVLVWLLAPIHYLSDCFKKNEKFNFYELFSKKVFGDFAINPFKMVLFYFSLPWLLISSLLKKLLGIKK
jgi:hypothetical protein